MIKYSRYFVFVRRWDASGRGRHHGRGVGHQAGMATPAPSHLRSRRRPDGHRHHHRRGPHPVAPGLGAGVVRRLHLHHGVVVVLSVYKRRRLSPPPDLTVGTGLPVRFTAASPAAAADHARARVARRSKSNTVRDQPDRRQMMLQRCPRPYVYYGFFFFFYSYAIYTVWARMHVVSRAPCTRGTAKKSYARGNLRRTTRRANAPCSTHTRECNKNR